jgi:hypothetical protein
MENSPTKQEEQAFYNYVLGTKLPEFKMTTSNSIGDSCLTGDCQTSSLNGLYPWTQINRCPNCGYCPCCGRANPTYPSYPNSPTYTPYSPPFPNTVYCGSTSTAAYNSALNTLSGQNNYGQKEI